MMHLWSLTQAEEIPSSALKTSMSFCYPGTLSFLSSAFSSSTKPSLTDISALALSSCWLSSPFLLCLSTEAKSSSWFSVCLCVCVWSLKRKVTERTWRGWEHMCFCKMGGFFLRFAPPQLSGWALPTRGCSTREGLAGIIWAAGSVGWLTGGPSFWLRTFDPCPDSPGLCCHGCLLVWYKQSFSSSSSCPGY